MPEPLVTSVPAIYFPNSDHLPAALTDAQARKQLIVQWLEAYHGQLGSAAFSVQRFMTAAQNRLVELYPEHDSELGAADYEHIKTWVFEALAAGKLVQAFDDDGNRIELNPPAKQSQA